MAQSMRRLEVAEGLPVQRRETANEHADDEHDEQELHKTKYDVQSVSFSSRSRPALPAWSHDRDGLWDTADEQFLDKVRCHVEIKITQIDPKDGAFAMRLKFHWWLRTLNTREKTRHRVRVPGVRMPRLESVVEESRIWREEALDSERSYCWGGTSVVAVTGAEIFEVHDFPFDRQAIHTGLLEFVWRSDKDSDGYDETMKVVGLTTETLSFLPEWKPFPAVVKVLDERGSPTYATRFKLLVRVERQTFYYVVQVFMVSTLITIASILPVVTKREEHAGDRVGIASGGLLTLIAFKYSVSEQLPTVPYNTYTTQFLLAQIVTLALVTLYNVLAYKLERLMKYHALKGNERAIETFDTLFDVAEDLLMLGLVLLWLGVFLYTYKYKAPKEWTEVIEDQDVIYGEVPLGPNSLLE